MSPELYQFIMTLAGVIISLLLVVIGYFLNKHVNVTETLTKAVNSLNITVRLLESSQANLASNVILKHQAIDMSLGEHTKKLEEHSASIVAIQTTLKNRKPRAARPTINKNK